MARPLQHIHGSVLKTVKNNVSGTTDTTKKDSTKVATGASNANLLAKKLGGPDVGGLWMGGPAIKPKKQ